MNKVIKPKILVFKNIFNCPDKERNQWVSPGALYLASALKKAGFRVIWSNSKISLGENELITQKEDLETILKDNPDIDFIGISICEDFFEKAQKLIEFLRKRTDAFIGVGGVMPTLTPEHVFFHLPCINFLVRGAGEEVFPRLVKILQGKNINSRLGEKEKSRLVKLNGVAFRNKYLSLRSSLDKINKIQDYDRSVLDFSFLNREDLTEGLNLFTSRGCFSNCFFCTTPGKGEYIAKSFDNLKAILKDYHKRLKAIFGNGIPAYAFKICFNDDDFLGDSRRAELFFPYLKSSPFRINFFQTGIKSFFEMADGRYTNKLNHKLINSLTPAIFSPDKRNIYIGTENFSDNELVRLGKGYGFSKIERVVETLAKKQIYQVHHFIASNQLTTPQDLLDNLIKIAVFKIRYGEYFSILTPIIPYLVSLYPSTSYRIALAKKREKFLNIRHVLSLKGQPQYNYPLVVNDIPINAITRKIISVLYKLFMEEKDYVKILDAILFNFLILREKMSAQKKEIQQIVEKYKDYPSIILKKTGFRLQNDRNNLQLMITRRCHLRCRYCPIIKKDSDMSREILYKAVDLLFTSSRKELRLDFTGGEPLLRFDLVKKGVEYAKRLARRENKTVSFYLVTNLIALNDEIADFLKNENFFLELSVDGEEKFHNLYKVGARPGINPYRLTSLQLNRIFSRRIDNYAVMVVSPKTVRYLGRNFYHLLKLGFRKVGINYALGLLWNKKDQREFFCQLDLVKKRFGSFIEKDAIKLSNLESRVEPAILNSEIMIDTDGKVHFLTDWLFERMIKEKVPALGKVGDFDNLNEIPLSRFRVLHRLLEYYTSHKIRKVIFNNIEMGNSVREYFKGWKRK